MTTAIHWFRKDLRLADNPALTAAVSEADAVVPAYVLAGQSARGDERIASRAWLPRTLRALDVSLRAAGNALVIRSGPAPETLAALAVECGAKRVYCQRDVSEDGLAEERAVCSALASVGVELLTCNGQLLVEPDALSTSQGNAYRVFTPYWRAWERMRSDEPPLPAPKRIPALTLPPATAGPLSTPRGGPDLERWWDVGERGALARLEGFVASKLAEYSQAHDRPDTDGTSELSMRLAWGELSPRQVAFAASAAGADAAQPFLRQLAWRDFSHHVMHRFPHTTKCRSTTASCRFRGATRPGTSSAGRRG